MFSEVSAKRGMADRSPSDKSKERAGLAAVGRPEIDAPVDTMMGGRSLEQPGNRPPVPSTQPDRLSLLEAQMKTLQRGISRSTEIQYKLDQMASNQQKQTREWEDKQISLNGQLCDVQEECRRLRDACSQAERKADERYTTAPLNRASSVQGFTTSRAISSEVNLSSLSQHTSPIANSTLITSKHLSTSNSSLDSVKSTQSMREAGTMATTPHLHKPASYRSTSHTTIPGLRSEGRMSSTEELEKANSKIRQLQREVVVLEQQLADKSRSARTHVEELMRLRSSLAQEKASLATSKDEIITKAASEASRLKALHTEKVAQLEGEVERLRRDKTTVDQEIGQLRADLKVSQAEKGGLMERVESLMSQLDQEKLSHEEAMRQLQTQKAGENSRVQRLEEALQECQRHLTQHMNTVTEADQQHRGSLQQVKEEVASLSADLAHTRQQLAQKTSMVSQLERELSEAKASFDERQCTWLAVERELKDSMEESEATRQTLLQQLEQTSRELARCTGWLGESQQVGSELRQCKAELSGLQKSLVDVQRRKEGLEQSLVACQQEKQSQALELSRMRRQWEQATSQLSALEGQSKSKLGLQDELSRKLESVKAELEGTRAQLSSCRSEAIGAEARVKQVEKESEEALEKLQQELSKRTQQVLEMDGMLRSHQADVTARRLQLERTLAQRQADLKARTQQLEELTTKYADAQKLIEQLRSQVIQSKTAGDGLTITQDRKLEAKAKEVLVLQEQLREALLAASNHQKEAEEERTQLEERMRREEELKSAHSIMEAKVDELQRQWDKMRQEHLVEVQQHQEAHASLLASREQLASSHKVQLQHLSDQERIRQEELSRCRAQVASLSAELAAERKVSEETRQQLAMMRSGLVYNQLTKPQYSFGVGLKDGTSGLHGEVCTSADKRGVANTTSTSGSMANTTSTSGGVANTTSTSGGVANTTSTLRGVADSEANGKVQMPYVYSAASGLRGKVVDL